MQESHFGPQRDVTHSKLKQAQELLTSLYMPGISEIPQNAQSKVIQGDRYSVEYFIEPTPQGERLLWASVNVPAPFSDSCAFLSLSPFPQGKAAESILSLLNRAHLAGAKAEQIFPELQALGKDATGMGWIPLLNLPLPKRVDLFPYRGGVRATCVQTC